MKMNEFKNYTPEEKKSLLLHWWHYYGKGIYTLAEIEQFEKMIDENYDQVWGLAIAGFIHELTSQPILFAMREDKVADLLATLPVIEEQSDEFKEAYAKAEKALLTQIVQTYNNPEPSVPMDIAIVVNEPVELTTDKILKKIEEYLNRSSEIVCERVIKSENGEGNVFGCSRKLDEEPYVVSSKGLLYDNLGIDEESDIWKNIQNIEDIYFINLSEEENHMANPKWTLFRFSKIIEIAKKRGFNIEKGEEVSEGLTYGHVAKKQRIKPRKIDIGAGSCIEDAVNLLLSEKANGNSVYLSFNGTKLYSSTVTMDNAYLKITGKTKAEFDKDQAEWLENSKKQSAEDKERAIADIPNAIERGKPFMYRQRHSSWAKVVEADANGIYHGLLVNNVIRLMEALENGASIDEAVKMMADQGHSGWSASLVNYIMLDHAKQGPEFYEAIVSSYRELNPEETEKIRMVRQENKGLIPKQHTKTQLQKLFNTLRSRDLWVTENVSNWDLKLFRQLREDLKNHTNDEILEMYRPRLETKVMRKTLTLNS